MMQPRAKINIFLTQDCAKHTCSDLRAALYPNGKSNDGITAETAIRALRAALCDRSVPPLVRQDIRAHAFALRENVAGRRAEAKCNVRVSAECLHEVLTEIESVLYAGATNVNRRVCVEVAFRFLFDVLDGGPTQAIHNVMAPLAASAFIEAKRICKQAKVEAGLKGSRLANEVLSREDRQRNGSRGGRARAKNMRRAETCHACLEDLARGAGSAQARSMRHTCSKGRK